MTSRITKRPKTELYSIPVAGGEPTKLTTIDMDTGGICAQSGWKTDRVHCVGRAHPVNSYTQPDLWVIDLLKTQSRAI